jgi:hypothetical protein
MEYFAGLDVSLDTISICILGGETASVVADPDHCRGGGSRHLNSDFGCDFGFCRRLASPIVVEFSGRSAVSGCEVVEGVIGPLG